LLSDLSTGESCILLLSSQGVADEVGPSSDPSVFRAALSSWRPAPVAGNHRAALEAAGRHLRQGSGPRRLVIVSDFQQSDWTFQESFVPAGVTVELIDVGSEGWQNAGITGSTVTSLAGGRVRVVASVRNFSETVQTRTVFLDVGGQELSQQVELPPLQNRYVAFAIDAGDAVEGILRMSEDDYAADDRYFFWLGAVPPVDVLCVVPAIEGARKATELFFLKKALSVRDDFESVSFRVEDVDAESFFALDLSSVRAVFLLGAAGYLGEAGFEALSTYLQGGGTVVCTPGESVAHEYHGFRQNGLIDGRFVSVVGEHDRAGETYGLSWVNPEGVLGRLFARPEETDLFLFPIRRYVRMVPSDSATVQLRLGDGDPALIERSVGSGRFFLFTVAFEPTWSDFPMTSVFLPMLRELLASAVPSGHGVRRIACGDPLPRITDLLGNEVKGSQARIPDTLTPGVLMLGDWPVEVNVSRDESTGLSVNTYDLRQTLTEAGAAVPGGLAGAGAGAGTVTVDLWRYFAVAVAVLALCELLATGLTDRREASGRSS
jgi:hypothetical protein